MKKEFKENFKSAAWTLIGALIFSFIIYSLNIYNSQFITARELNPIELKIKEIVIHLQYIKHKLSEIDEKIK